MNVLRKKALQDPAFDSGMKRNLSATELTLFGLGSTIGSGVFVLTGVVAATHAGPAIVLSLILSGFACGCAVLSYAELAGSVGGCGSAYGYGYAALGELPAWIIGWMLLCEYMVALPAVATGWSGYADTLLRSGGLELPRQLVSGPFEAVSPGLVNLPAMLIVVAAGAMLLTGAKMSSHINALLSCAKVGAILLFLFVAVGEVKFENWLPFIPARETMPDGSERYGIAGVMSGSATIFFAYLGIDTVATTAEETRNPQRDVPIGLISTLVICTGLYIAVAAVLTGVTSYRELNVPSPVAAVLLGLGKNWAAGLVSIGAITGLTTAILVTYYGLTRVLLAMSRDRLIPGTFAKLTPNTRVPRTATLLSGVIMCIAAGVVPLENLAKIANIGTLGCFVAACIAMLVMRRAHPNLPRPFRVPLGPLLPVLGIISCGSLMLMLGKQTWTTFGIWMTLGMLVYVFYSYRNSRRAHGSAQDVRTLA